MSAVTGDEIQLRRQIGRSGWLGHLTRWSLATLLGFGGSALLLAMIGLMTPWLALPLGLIGSYLVGRWIPSQISGSVSDRTAIALLIVVSSVAIVGISAPHEHILATRDSGTYVATAAWIAETGGLRMEVRDPVFDGSPVRYESLGFQAGASESSLMPQFLHIFPSMLALIGSFGSTPNAMYWLNPVIAGIGLLALFAFARAMMSQILALFATILVAASLPFLYFSRAPFTEALAFAFVFGGLWIASLAVRDSSLRLATGAGLLFGGLMLTRIDGVVVLLGLVAYRTLQQLGASANPRSAGAPDNGVSAGQVRVMDRMIAVAVVMFAVAMIDGAVFSLQYLVDHGMLISLVLGAVLLLTVTGRLAPHLSETFQRHRTAIANMSAGLIALFFVYSWGIRPLVETPERSDTYGITGLQEAAGVAIDPLRSYAELSVHWLIWYLGIPLVALGLAGLIFYVRRMLLGQEFLAGHFTSVSAVLTLLYLYRPSINPDHIWAMRRFVPLVLPALVVMAVALIARTIPRLGRWARPTGLVLGLTLAVPVLITTGHAGLDAEFEGAGTNLLMACDSLGPNSAVIFVGEGTATRSNALAPALRGFCGVGVAAEDAQSPLSPAEIERLAVQAASDGRRLWVVGDSAGAPTTSVTLMDDRYQFLELTLFEAPREWWSLDIRLSAWEVTS